MKVAVAFLFFISLTRFPCSAQVLIKGKILDYDGKSLVYYHPIIEGIFTPYWKEVKPAGNGTFRLVYENHGYGSATVSYKGIVYQGNIFKTTASGPGEGAALVQEIEALIKK